MNRQWRQGFTLIELLVVIAIIAILAAILFPVFAQAKLAAKKASDLSNTKQVCLSVFMYTGDNDDGLMDSPADGIATESYVFAAKLQPYVKNFNIFHCPSSPYQMGSVQHNQHDVPGSLGGGFYMTPPSDPCVGLPVSRYGTSDSATSNYFNDIYPPTDYALNPILWGYAEGGCPSGGATGGYSHPGGNMTTGNNPTGGNGQNTGVNGLGAGQVTYTSVAKVPLLYDFPTDNQRWPGPAFWGSSYNGMFNGQCNLTFLDGHSKSFPIAQMLAGTPGSINAAAYPYNGNIVTEQNWNPPFDGVHQVYGQMFYWWGTQLANSANQ
jgi:prepilin-type N-terminal cleavage/methylation domain-containing protein/prepilin-type processing-associated H-X9-DG protein